MGGLTHIVCDSFFLFGFYCVLLMLAFPNIDPVAFSLGPLQIRWYGISYVVGILTAWLLLHQRAKKIPEICSTEQLADLVFYLMLGILVGGRCGFFLFYHIDVFLQNPIVLLKIHQGGMSFHGGLLGVLVAIWWYGKKIDKSFFALADFIAPVVPVGLFCGRIANFINGELWGKASSVPWAVVFPDPRAGGIARHPSQLYEAALEGIVLFLILWFFSMKQRPLRAVSGLFLVGYGVFRFLVEFVREPDQHIGYLAFAWFTVGQLLSLPMFVFGIILLFCAYRTVDLQGPKS